MTTRTIAITIASFTLAFAAACSGGSSGAPGPRSSEQAGAGEPRPVIHRVAAPEAGLFVNAYLIETERGLIAVDTALRVSDARAVRAEIERLGVPLVAVVLTHGHPDHYNGAAELVAGRDVPIYATPGVARVVRRDDAAKEAQWSELFGDEWPSRRVFPDRTVADREELEVAGMTITVRDIGPAESHHDSVWILEGTPRRVFVGDLVFNDMHSYLSDGHTSEWLDALDQLEREVGDATLYPGHGAPGGAELIQAQRRYLEVYRETVRSLGAGADALDDSDKAKLAAAMNDHLGNDRLEFLVGLGADAVHRELAAGQGAQPE